MLNENEWAKSAIESKSLGKKPFETLTRVARYYIDSGMTQKEVRSAVEEFILACDKTASIPKWSHTIDTALSKASKREAINIEYVPISKWELQIIDDLDGIQIKRLAFTLLCLAKYWHEVNESCDYWVNNKDSEIMRMANVNTSIKKQSLMYHSLNELGLVQFSKKVDNTNVRVCFANNGEVAMKVTDFRNLGYQYMMFSGDDGFIKCASCGIIVKKNNKPKYPGGPMPPGRPQMYCRECTVSINTQRNVNATMSRSRNFQKRKK